MHLDEMAFVLILECGTGSAVGFVADDEVESGEAALLLRFTDDIDGVVSREHHFHVVVVVALDHFGCEMLAVRRGRVLQLVAEHFEVIVAAFLADVAVRTHGEAV